MTIDQQPSLSQWENQLRHACRVANKGGRSLKKAEEFLTRCGEENSTFGIEFISLPNGGELQYLNPGDTYTVTACQLDGGEIFVSCWGDEFEKAEHEHEEESETLHCGHCGEYSAQLAKSHRKNLCEHCGHNPYLGI